MVGYVFSIVLPRMIMNITNVVANHLVVEGKGLKKKNTKTLFEKR